MRPILILVVTFFILWFLTQFVHAEPMDFDGASKAEVAEVCRLQPSLCLSQKQEQEYRSWQKKFHGCSGLVVRGEDKGKKLWGILHDRHNAKVWYVVKDLRYNKRDVRIEPGCSPGVSPQ
jgi:hypothetical protein